MSPRRRSNPSAIGTASAPAPRLSRNPPPAVHVPVAVSFAKPLGVHRARVIPAADRLHAKELAALEGCSVRTARRLMASGELGPVLGRSTRDRWITRPAYHAWVRRLCTP